MVNSKVKYPPLAIHMWLLGANVAGQANFESIAWFAFLESHPLVFGGKVLSPGKGVKIRLYQFSLSSSADPNA